MGMRYRKSIKMGPVRINASKSGVGWSVGTKGARYTKTANGRTRTTVGIPGTGLSWVDEKGAKKANTAQKPRMSLTERLENVPESKVSYRHWPAKYQKEMKWMFISVIPIFLLGITVPVPMLLGVFGWIVWVIIFMIRTFIYSLRHRDEFTNDEALDAVVNHTENIYESDEAEAERELVEIPTVLPQETSNIESGKEPIHEEVMIEDVDEYLGEPDELVTLEVIHEDMPPTSDSIENDKNNTTLLDEIDEFRRESGTADMPVPSGIDDPEYRNFYLNYERTGIEFFDEYVVVDVETTGFDYEEDLIVQIAAVKVRDGAIIDKFQGFNNKSYLSKFLKENSPIQQEDIDSGLDIELLLRGFISFIGNDVLIGHNIGFDLTFLRFNMHKHELGDLTNPFGDTMIIGKYFANKGWSHHRVDDYIAYYKEDVGVLNLAQHSAENDVLYEQRIYEIERMTLGTHFKAHATLKMSWAMPKVRVVETDEQRKNRFIKKFVKANRIAIDEKDFVYSNKILNDLLCDGFTQHSKLYKRMAMNYKRLHNFEAVLETIELWEVNVGEHISNTDREWIENQKFRIPKSF